MSNIFSAVQTYRLSNCSDITVKKEKQVMKEKLLEERGRGFLKELKRNYDPFLSYGKRVKVKLTEEGQRLLKVIYYNRPKKIAVTNDGEILFECSEQKAIAYFFQFLDEVEIIEPIELREKFKEKLESALLKHKN